MKFRNYLETIADIGIYPLVSLLLFFAFFTGLLGYVFSLSKKETSEMADMPLRDGTFPKVLLLLLLGFTGPDVNAQPASETYNAGDRELLLAGIVVALIFIVMIVVSIVLLTLRVARQLRQRQTGEAGNVVFSPAWWRRFGGVGVRLSEEEKILIRDHEYDGIQELDNRMPPWLAFLFQGTIAFAVVYMVVYHGLKIGDLPEAELDKALKAAEIQKAAFLEREGARTDENTVTVVTEAKELDAGKTLFQANCAACHGQAGEGTVGPNLTDEYWLHGGGIRNIFKTIKYGIPEKGMIAWEKQLKPREIQLVSSYILSLAGTNPPNPKAAQGELWKEEPAAAPGSNRDLYE